MICHFRDQTNFFFKSWVWKLSFLFCNRSSASNLLKQIHYSYLLGKLNTKYFLKIWRKFLAVHYFIIFNKFEVLQPVMCRSWYKSQYPAIKYVWSMEAATIRNNCDCFLKMPFRDPPHDASSKSHKIALKFFCKILTLFRINYMPDDGL